MLLSRTVNTFFMHSNFYKRLGGFWRKGTPPAPLVGAGEISHPLRLSADYTPPPTEHHAAAILPHGTIDPPTDDEEEEPIPPPLRPLPPELHYLDQLIRYRIDQAHHRQQGIAEPAMPPYDQWQLPIGNFIIQYNIANEPSLTVDEARLLLIALTPHVQPDFFDLSINSALNGDSDFPRIGGSRGKNFRGFIPTGETAIFLLAGEDWKLSLVVQGLFWADHTFAVNKILWLGDVEQAEPALSGKLILSQDYVDALVHDKVLSPRHSINFPAKLITNPQERRHLVMSEQLTADFNHLIDWVLTKKQVETHWKDGKKGYRCLFHGPSGTGKTFATCILGKETKRDVYRIDLSMVVSKYIGETEKNLELIFARAEKKDWILFFDEADALFGKRTNIRDAHDKYANQEASFLLQRIEDYDGLVILATNMKNNIDDAFLRRFDSDLKFSMPNGNERKMIWQNSFPDEAKFLRGGQSQTDAAAPKPDFYLYHRDKHKKALATNDANTAANTAAETPKPEKPTPTLNIPDLVKGYALTGANIQNVVRYATIRAVKRQSEANEKNAPLTIDYDDVIDGIRRELSKNGIPFHAPRQNTINGSTSRSPH
jgi:hypothetical protein